MAVRLGLIGSGRWGRNIERTLLGFDDVSVVLVGRNEPLRRDFDGVLIATPSTTHAELALPYIEAGISTFIEKPMTTSVIEAQRIREAAERSCSPVFVGHVQLYNPAFLEFVKILSGLGEIRYASCESANGNPRVDSSVLWDWLPHDLSMAQMIFCTTPAAVQAWALSNAPNCQAAVTRFDYGGKSLLSTISWQSQIRQQRLTVVAERATLILDDRAQHRLTLYGLDGNISYPEYGNEPPLTAELCGFLDMVRLRSSNGLHIALGTLIAEAIEAAEKSMSNDGVIVEIRP
jgi:UDP-N-acetylglucosamine 3-dehydrogenase